MMKTVWTTLLACIAYATIRYNGFKGVAWSEWPVYTLNKSLALASLLLMMIYVIQRQRGVARASRAILIPAWLLMLAHVGLSVFLLSPAYYGKYFIGAKLTWQAGWSMLLGVLATVFFHRNVRFCELTENARLVRITGLIGCASGVHAGLLGYPGWFTPQHWPGYMVPITLISFVAGAIALIVSFRKPRATQDASRD